MPYTIQIDAEHSLLDLQYYGTVTIAQRFETVELAKPMLHDSGVRRVLVDLTHATWVREPFSRHSDFVACITREPILLASRIAFVVARAHPINHLIEVLADARHFPFSRFSVRLDALNWLCSDADPVGSNPPDK